MKLDSIVRIGIMRHRYLEAKGKSAAADPTLEKIKLLMTKSQRSAYRREIRTIRREEAKEMMR